jgi:hypothetical protein
MILIAILLTLYVIVLEAIPDDLLGIVREGR